MTHFSLIESTLSLPSTSVPVSERCFSITWDTMRSYWRTTSLLLNARFGKLQLFTSRGTSEGIVISVGWRWFWFPVLMTLSLTYLSLTQSEATWYCSLYAFERENQTCGTSVSRFYSQKTRHSSEVLESVSLFQLWRQLSLSLSPFLLHLSLFRLCSSALRLVQSLSASVAVSALMFSAVTSYMAFTLYPAAVKGPVELGRIIGVLIVFFLWITVAAAFPCFFLITSNLFEPGQSSVVSQLSGPGIWSPLPPLSRSLPFPLMCLPFSSSGMAIEESSRN